MALWSRDNPPPNLCPGLCQPHPWLRSTGGGGVGTFMFQQPLSAVQIASLQGKSGERQGPRESLSPPYQAAEEVGENQAPGQKIGSEWDQARAAPPPASPLSPHPAPCNQGPPAPQVGPPGSLCKPPWALESASFPPHPRPGWGHRDTSAVLRLQLSDQPERHKRVVVFQPVQGVGIDV